MFHFSNDQDFVTNVAIWLSLASFALFIVQSAWTTFFAHDHIADKKKVKNAMGLLSDKVQSLNVPTVSDLKDLLDSFSKVMDSLTKAGPAVMCLGASILFLLIAAVSSGAFQGSPVQGSGQQSQTDTKPPTNSP